jgi:nicotinamidase-related amidase
LTIPTRERESMSDAVYPSSTASALLVVDIQERLVPAMEPADISRTLRQTALLIAAAREFGWPVYVTEQYPKGLGRTVEVLAGPLAEAGATHVEKLEFSCVRNEEFQATVMPRLPNHVIVTGVEAHVCVLQTATDLQARGHQVYIPFDAVSSRSNEYKENGLSLAQRAGAVVTNAETAVFFALQRAGGDAFKRLSKLIK